MAAGAVKLLDGATKLAKELLEKGWVAQALVWPAFGTLGLASGYGVARAVSPRSIGENTDKELEQEALATEIDVTTRKIAALENRKKQRGASTTAQRPYDRFV